MKTNTTPTVNAIEQINLSGNMIPASWYQEIKTDTGKTALLAISILADILYWYKPTIVRDEATGAVISKTKKFKSDKLQKKYKHYADFFGFPKDTVTDAIDLLVARGLITREFRTVHTGTMVLNNVMFLEPVPAKIVEITFKADGLIGESQTGSMAELPDTLPNENTDTNTKITTETKETKDINTSSSFPSKPRPESYRPARPASPAKPKATQTPSPDAIRMQNFVAAWKKCFQQDLGDWQTINPKTGKPVTGRWVGILNWAKKEGETSARVEYANNTFRNDAAWAWHQDKPLSPDFFKTNWPRLTEGYCDPSQQSQLARPMTRSDFIDDGGI